MVTLKNSPLRRTLGAMSLLSQRLRAVFFASTYKWDSFYLNLRRRSWPGRYWGKEERNEETIYRPTTTTTKSSREVAKTLGCWKYNTVASEQ